MPLFMYLSNVLISLSWAIVSNAALRSRSASIAPPRLSTVYHFVHEVMLFPYYATVCKLTGLLHIDHPGDWLIEHILCRSVVFENFLIKYDFLNHWCLKCPFKILMKLCGWQGCIPYWCEYRYQFILTFLEQPRGYRAEGTWLCWRWMNSFSDIILWYFCKWM